MTRPQTNDLTTPTPTHEGQIMPTPQTLPSEGRRTQDVRKDENEQRIRILELELELERLKAGGSVLPGDAQRVSSGRGGQFRLLAGQHIGDDGVVYARGQVVPSRSDLVLKFGGEKFLRVSDRLPTPKTFLPERNVPTHQTSFPHGQVSKGHPEVQPGMEEVSDMPTNAQGPASPETYAKEEARVQAAADKAKGKDDDQHTGESRPSAKARERERESVLTAAGDDGLDTETEGDGEGGNGNAEDLHTMTVAELRELAEGDEIDLKGAVKKDDIIKKINEARKA